MKKSLFGSLLLSLILCFLIGAVGTVSAETDPAPPPPSDRAPDSARRSIDVHTHTDRSTAGADLIKLWSCGIEDNGDGSVYIMSETRTYATVAYLDATIYLQRWNGSEWVDVTSRPYVKSNSSSVSGSSKISVTRGFYYRTRGVHTAQDGGSYSSQASLSQALLIN
jgi:hypothetical protein